MIISSFIHVAADGIIIIIFVAEYYSIEYMYHMFFICLYVGGHLVVFMFVNSAAMNIGMHVSF